MLKSISTLALATMALSGIALSAPAAEAQSLQYWVYGSNGFKMGCCTMYDMCQRQAQSMRGSCVSETKRNSFGSGGFGSNGWGGSSYGIQPAPRVKYCVYTSFGSKTGCYAREMCIRMAQSSYGSQCYVVKE